MGYRAVPNSPKTAAGKDKYIQGKYNLINPSKYLGEDCILVINSPSWLL